MALLSSRASPHQNPFGLEIVSRISLSLGTEAAKLRTDVRIFREKPEKGRRNKHSANSFNGARHIHSINTIAYAVRKHILATRSKWTGISDGRCLSQTRENPPIPVVKRCRRGPDTESTQPRLKLLGPSVIQEPASTSRRRVPSLIPGVKNEVPRALFKRSSAPSCNVKRYW